MPGAANTAQDETEKVHSVEFTFFWGRQSKQPNKLITYCDYCCAEN